MAGICSAHQSNEPVEGCANCHALPRDIFPDWDEKLVDAEASGITECAGEFTPWKGVPESCGFRYYAHADACPRCGEKNENVMHDNHS